MGSDVTENFERKAMMEAVVKTTVEVPSLIKGDRNTHGGYSYVSVDDYYEAVKTIASKNGLAWVAREVSSDLVDTGKSIALKTTYAFDMMHAPSGAVWHDYSQLSVLHPLIGAQTAGSSLSYADKLMMRSCFKIVTGEGDADQTDNRAFEASAPVAIFPAKPALVVVGKPLNETAAVSDDVMKDDAQRIFDLAYPWVWSCLDLTELEKYWTDNEPTYQIVKSFRPDLYRKLVQAFKDKKAELKNG